MTSPLDDLERSATEALVIEVLRTIRDPELPVSIWEMGLVYGIDVAPGGAVTITMTLTTPMCPAAGTLPVFDETLGLKEISRKAARDAERQALLAVLQRVHWHRADAARILKVSYKTLLNRIRDLKLEN